MTTPDHIRAHRHCRQHRDEVLGSERCGCFYCCEIFSPLEIDRWTDEWEGIGRTAICPKCRIDAVIGSECGYPITAEFLGLMRRYWFERTVRLP
jgi:hypothetical protein